MLDLLIYRLNVKANYLGNLIRLAVKCLSSSTNEVTVDAHLSLD